VVAFLTAAYLTSVIGVEQTVMDQRNMSESRRELWPG